MRLKMNKKKTYVIQTWIENKENMCSKGCKNTKYHLFRPDLIRTTWLF